MMNTQTPRTPAKVNLLTNYTIVPKTSLLQRLITPSKLVAPLVNIRETALVTNLP
jgi:hypothetical protein